MCVCVCLCVCVCVCVCVWANHLDVVRLGIKVDQGLHCVRHYIPRSSGKPLRTLDGTQTLEGSWSLKRAIRIASDVDLVLLGDNSDKSDLAKDQVSGGIALGKGGGRILSEREECYPFCCLFASYLGKLFDDGTQQQPIHVLVERHESYR